MKARSICTAVLFLLGSVACEDDPGIASSAIETTDAGESDDNGERKAVRDSKDDEESDDKTSSGKSSDSSSDDKASDDKASTDKAKNDKSGDDKTAEDDDDAGVAEVMVKEPADYSKAENWLCRPGHNELCERNIDSTIVHADGSTELEKYEAASDPEIDCFYVYPTVSLDETPNSDLKPGPEEEAVVLAQFARFGSKCRLFAPMYRQVTLTALRASLAGMSTVAPDREIGLKDVLAAFNYYLLNDNKGRPFVLVGHSQGSGVLTQLIKRELDQELMDSRFLTALLIGTNIQVPKDKAVGGTFKHLPVCEWDTQLGCIVTYASFREDVPPPDDSRFGTSSDPSMVSACVNPAKESGNHLHAYLNAKGPGLSSKPMGEWATDLTVDTPFVSVPWLLDAECKMGKTGSYLSIKVNADPDDPRTDDIVGDVITDGMVSASWGLHVIDVHLAMGNLIDLVQKKIDAYQEE